VKEAANRTFSLELKRGKVGLGWKVIIKKKQGMDEHNEGTHERNNLKEFKDNHLQHKINQSIKRK
jgi:hypothetical protein